LHPAGGLVIANDGDPRNRLRFSHHAMATVFEVHASHADPTYAAQAAQAAFEVVDRLEREFSRFLPNSDIARINRLEAGQRTRVSRPALECLLVAQQLYELTGGAFDVSIGTGLQYLELNSDEFEVRAARGDVRLDLGGIGKGYAVDLVAELVEEWGLHSSLVHGGFSSVLALEPPAGASGWRLTLSDPGDRSRVLAHMSARQTALGASGTRKGDHIADPRTGEPVRGRLAAWAVLPRPIAAAGMTADRPPILAAAAAADALATAFMVLCPDEVRKLCRSNAGLEAWILQAPPAGESQASLLHFGGP
jgi:thiamine biosynthesis lipoprotein